MLLSCALGALHDISQAWDVWYYHLPFAARLAGIVPARAFEFHASNQARFDGFPLLGELLQGLVWRITGRAEGANLVAFATVPLFAWFAKRRLGVPMHLTVLALLAIPLVQTHVTSCTSILPANAALAVVLLLAIQAYALDRAPEPAALALALVAAAIAANMKALLHPLVACALVVLAVQTARKLRARARAAAPRDADRAAYRLRHAAEERRRARKSVLPGAPHRPRPDAPRARGSLQRDAAVARGRAAAGPLRLLARSSSASAR